MRISTKKAGNFKTKTIHSVFVSVLFLLFTVKTFADCATINTSFTASQSVICGSGSYIISFTQTSTGTGAAAATYKWYMNNVQFGGTTTFAGAPPNSGIISAVGTYTFMMIATGAASCKDTAIVNVYIRPVPAASFTFSPNTSQCIGTPITFTNTSTGTGAFTSYLWNFGDGTTSTSISPTHTYSTGAASVSLTINNGGTCTNTASNPITVLVKPIQNFTATPSPGCATQTVTFGNTTTGEAPATNFHWNFGNGNTSTGVKVPAPQIYHTGTYTIMMVAGNGCGLDTMYRSIEIDTIPKAIMSVSSVDGCTPLTLGTTNSSTGGNLTYQWFVDGVSTSTSATMFPVLTAPSCNTLATHIVRLLVSNQCGGGVHDTTVSIKVHPAVNTIISPSNATICAGQNFQFSYTQTACGDSLSYLWNFGNGHTSTLLTPLPESFANPGSYSTRITVNGFCGSSADTSELTVFPTPNPPTGLNDTICSGNRATLFASLNSAGGNIQWYGVSTGGTMLNQGASYYTPSLTANTTYWIQTEYQGCVSSRVPVYVTVIPLPAAPTSLSAIICQGFSATLNATAPLGASFQWYDTVTAGTVLFTGPSYTTPVLSITKKYYVLAIVNHCPGPRTKDTVTVKPTPALPTAASVSVCTGNTATLTATAPGGTYEWYDAPTAGTLLSTGAVYIIPSVAATTIYYVQTTINGCVGPRKAVTVTVNPFPTADIVPDVNAGCVGLMVNFTNNSTPGGTYLWHFNGAVPATSNQYIPPTKTFTSSGVKLVWITATVLGCSTNDSTYINIDPKPVPSFTATPASFSGCTPVSRIFNNTSPVTAGDTYFWTLGNGITSVLQNPPSQIYTTTTSDNVFNIKLVITALNGCRDSITHAVTVHPNPVALFTPNPNDTVCANTSLQFLNGSSPNGVATYLWRFGDGTTSTLTNPTHIYGSPNNYIARLIATTSFSCKDSTQQLIVIDSLPVAAFSNTSACFGVATKFTNSSTGNIVSRSWDFGDSSPHDTALSPQHTYAASGTYNVTLTDVNLLGCSKSVTHPVIVKSVPIAAFSAPTECMMHSTLFNNQTTVSPISWMWNFGDLGTSALQNPSHVYADSGTYSVTLVAFSASGCSDTVTNPVKVNLIPSANFTSAAVCKNDTMFFSSTSLYLPNTYSWNFGNGFTDNTNNPAPKFVYTIAGTYNVILTAGYSATGCTNSITIPVIVHPRTVPNFSSTTPCLNAATVFTDNTLNTPTQWKWNFGDGSAVNTSQSPVYSYAGAGIYTVKLIAANTFGCRDSITKTTVVNPLPTAVFVFDTVCDNTAISFTDQSVSASTWSWNFNDGSPVSTIRSPSHLFPGNGSYNVKLVVTNSLGCLDSITHAVFVKPNPVAAFSAATACHTYPTVFNDSSVSAAKWSWNYADGSALDTLHSPLHTYANPGSYTVILTVKNLAGCSNSASHTVLINTIPTAAFSATTPCLGDSTVFTDQTIGNVIGWTWDFNDGSALSSLHNPKHKYAAAGVYHVMMIASGGSGCADTVTNLITVNPLAGTDFSFTPECTKDTISFNNTSTGAPDTFSWSFGNGYSDNTNNPTPKYAYAAAGTYNVTFTAGYLSTGCTKSITKSVTVFPRTIPNFTSSTPCLYYSSVFTDNTAGSPVKWNWNFGDGTAHDTLQNPTHGYAASVSYTVTLITKNVFGCADSIVKTAVVNTLPVAVFAFDTVCAGTSTTFTDHSTAAVSWIWDFGDGSAASISNSPVHLYAIRGTYAVTLIVSNSLGCTDTVIHSIIVNPNPVAAFTTSAACHTYPTIFTDHSTAAAKWYWNFGDVTAIDTLQSPQHIYANPGNYSVQLEVKTVFGCSNSVSQFITVLPNPVAANTITNLCARDSAVFTDNSTGTGISNWLWDFGDGFTSALRDPVHAFLGSGNYTVSLIVTNTSGCADTIVKQEVVHTIPKPMFSVIPGCAGTMAAFTDLSTDAVPINAWVYNFDDGNTASVKNPNHIFLNGAGVYNVLLKVTNVNGCDSSVTIPVTVDIVPAAHFHADTICVGTPTSFTDFSTGNPIAWLWDFGDGSIDSTSHTASHLYAAGGVYIASLKVTSFGGCNDIVFRIIQVRSDVHAGIIAINNTCLNTLVAMHDNTTIALGNLLSDTWDYGDGSLPVTTLNTSHTYVTAGTYYITHTVMSDGGCANTALDTIVVNPYPGAHFTAANTCELQPSIFNDSSIGPPVTWHWNFGDGGTSILQNPTHLYASANNYSVTLIISSGMGCGDTVTNTITVYPKPAALFTSSKVCWGDTTVFTNNSTLSSGTISNTWWSFGDGTTDTTFNASHVLLTLKDTFTVKLAILTSLGCVDTLTKLVETYPLNEFHFAPFPLAGCNKFTTTFRDSSTVSGGNIVNWFWDFGDGNYTDFFAPTHTYVTPGSYYPSLTVTSSYGCKLTDTLHYAVVVHPTPSAAFTPSPYHTDMLTPDIQFNDNTVGATFWDYDFGDLTTSINPNPNHTYQDTGTYTVVLIVNNQFGCRDTVKHEIKIDPITTAYFPNAFTPDGNNLNETFRPRFFGVIEFNMVIYDRWGSEVFRTRDIDEGWNGRFEGVGDVIKQDVYVYKVDTKDIFMNSHKYTGRVTLVK